ncbi:MAG: RDD family protein [Gammaproteobacteria bacterium]|jgi:uncharacterized RDD family membrane protein YckC
MTCWDELQLAPTQDVRAIKKAYAVLLKQNRPDDNPQGFQRLYAAYQDALAWAENQIDGGDEHPGTEPPAVTELATPRQQDDHATPGDAHAPAQLDEEAQWETYLDQQWDALVSRVEDLLTDPAHRNDPAAWRFLMESEALLDIDFKAAFAMRFLQRLLELFREQRDEGGALIEPGLIQHLNQWFWWSERRHHYEDYADPELLDDFMLWWQGPSAPAPIATVTPTVERRTPAPQYGNYYLRWLALAIDCLALFGLGTLGGLLLEQRTLEPVLGFLAIMLGYPPLSAVFEASSLRATPGKYWCKLQVCNPQGGPIGLFRALWRSLLFAVCLYFFYITVIVNLLIWDGRLLHDRLSRTIVLKRT